MKVVNELYIVNIEMCKQSKTEENDANNLNYKYSLAPFGYFYRV